MACCALCNDLGKRDSDDPRLAFDFTPDELRQSAVNHGCLPCLVIYKGLLRAEVMYSGGFHEAVKIVYARCHGGRETDHHNLTLQVYFIDERPKIKLEFYSLQPRGM